MHYTVLSDNYFLISAIHAICQGQLMRDEYQPDIIFIDFTSWHPPADMYLLSGEGAVVVFIISAGHNTGRFVDYLDLKQSASYIISPEDSEYSIRKLLVRIKINHIFNKKYGDSAYSLKRKKLSFREIYIMNLIMFGYKDDMISEMLSLNHKTVSRIRLELLKKLNFNNINIKTLPLVKQLLKVNPVEEKYV